MESLSEHEAMRVLQAAAALDAARATSGSLAPAPSGTSRQPAAQPQLQGPEAAPPTPSQGLGDDVWREMAETDSGTPEQKRLGDLDSWLDVFRATATIVRNAWTHMECLTFESLAFGWLALARKHEALQVVPSAAPGEELDDIAPLAHWLGEAAWAQAAYTAGSAEQLAGVLGVQPADLIVYQADPEGWRPAFFIAIHHDSRTVRLVVRGTGHLRDLLTNKAGRSAPLGAGIAALVALLAETETATAEALGRPPSVRATVFASPPCVTAELAEASSAYVEAIVYNALRRSGALGLANHLVAAALCRCQPPQDAAAGPHGPAPPAATGLPPRPAISAGLSALSKAGAAGVIPPAPPNGRAAQLAALGSAVKAVASSATASAAAAETHAGPHGSRVISAAPSGTLAAPGPMGPPNGALPPLVTGAAVGGVSRTAHEPPLRRGTDAPGVLSPPPLVAAANAQTAAAVAAAVGPTPPRKGLTGFLPDMKGASQQEGRGPAPASGVDSNSGAWPRTEAGMPPSAVVVLEPLAAPPVLPAGSVVAGGHLASLPSLPPGPRRDPVLGAAAPGHDAAGGAATPSGPHALSQPSSPRSRRQPVAEGTEAEDSVVDAARQEQRAADGRTEGEGSSQDAAAAGRQEAYEYHELLVPGRLYMIERKGADATASFRLLRDIGRTQLNRMLLKRSMLRDHLLSHYAAALERVFHP
ncbi:hypothetical protein GPECTOR_14g180 [Gonium pectorale]|uniref:Uncharacterized protein n=1 Tax=Gonium pectorale TaxID=33097 RepID=A0A150GME9_GONPE|nr:hypothetical protein GPECTOR_14g180 [Gonium pectorale]|eukprot:KXZ50935.1 hypothetical protein GPECTOR_14g180 [Gonium pectorale]